MPEPKMRAQAHHQTEYADEIDVDIPVEHEIKEAAVRVPQEFLLAKERGEEKEWLKQKANESLKEAEQLGSQLDHAIGEIDQMEDDEVEFDTDPAKQGHFRSAAQVVKGRSKKELRAELEETKRKLRRSERYKVFMMVATLGTASMRQVNQYRQHRDEERATQAQQVEGRIDRAEEIRTDLIHRAADDVFQELVVTTYGSSAPLVNFAPVTDFELHPILNGFTDPEARREAIMRINDHIDRVVRTGNDRTAIAMARYTEGGALRVALERGQVEAASEMVSGAIHSEHASDIEIGVFAEIGVDRLNMLLPHIPAADRSRLLQLTQEEIRRVESNLEEQRHSDRDGLGDMIREQEAALHGLRSLVGRLGGVTVRRGATR